MKIIFVIVALAFSGSAFASTGVSDNSTLKFQLFDSVRIVNRMSPSAVQTYVGIGVVLGQIDHESIHVDGFVTGAPAESSGLMTGDVIVGVRESPASQMIDVSTISLSELVQLIRGPQGTAVELLIVRGSSQPMSFSILRASFDVDDGE